MHFEEKFSNDNRFAHEFTSSINLFISKCQILLKAKCFKKYIILKQMSNQQKPIQWMWIDKDCYNEENSKLFKQLKLYYLNIKRFPDINSFMDSYSEFDSFASPTAQIPCFHVVCSSSLEQNIYYQLDKLQKVANVMIYCYRMKKGLDLMRKFEKIQRVFTKDETLIAFLLGTKKKIALQKTIALQHSNDNFSYSLRQINYSQSKSIIIKQFSKVKINLGTFESFDLNFIVVCIEMRQRDYNEDEIGKIVKNKMKELQKNC